MKTSTSIFLALSLWGNHAFGDVLVSRSDTHVKLDNSGPYGSEESIVVKKSGGGSGINVRKGFISFEVENAAKVKEAKLLLDVASFNDTNGLTSAEFYVWGVQNKTVPFHESELTYNQAGIFTIGSSQFWTPLLSSNGTGVNESSPQLYDANTAQAGKQPLGILTISSADLNKTVSFSSAALVDYIKASPLGDATILLTRKTDSGSLNTSFASKESTSLQGPRLLVSSAEAITVTDDASVMLDNTGPYGATSAITIKNALDANSTQKGALEFTFDAARDVSKASLSLHVSGGDMPSSADFLVWGIRDGGAYEDFDDSTLLYNQLKDAGYLNNTISLKFNLNNWSMNQYTDGVSNENVVALGSFSVDSSDLNKAVTFTSADLVDFINENNNQKVTLLITRKQDSSTAYTSFAAEEHPSLPAPTLAVEYAHSDSYAPSYELLYKDLDGDAQNELLFIINNPGGNGRIVSDPMVIAEFARALGYGFGSDLSFWNALSVTQQDFVEMVVAGFNPAAAQDGVINAAELNSVFASLPDGREYSITPFTGTYSDALAGLSASYNQASSALTAAAMSASSTATIGVNQAAAYFSEGGFVVGAQQAMLGVSLATDAASFSAELGVSLWSKVSAGKGLAYGLWAPISADMLALSTSIYAKGDSAVGLYQDAIGAIAAGAEEADLWFDGAFASSMSWGGNSVLAMNDFAEDTYLNASTWVGTNGTVGALWIADQGQSTAIWMYGSANEINETIIDGVFSVVTPGYDAAANACDSAEAWLLSTGASSVSSAYNEAEGWILGVPEDVDSLADDAGEVVGEVAEDVGEVIVDTCGCICSASCF